MQRGYTLIHQSGAAQPAQSRRRGEFAYECGWKPTREAAAMDLMNTDLTSYSDAPFRQTYSLDMALAARTSVPVLITAGPGLALAMAVQIAAQADRPGAEGVFVVDAADGQDLAWADTGADGSGAAEPTTVIVHDVHALGKAQQLQLMALMNHRTPHGDSRWRIIATTTVSLYDQVTQGLFHDRLFYRLNAIHILAGAEQSTA